MPSTFWSNTIWFLLLGIMTVLELIFILSKAKDRKYVLALFFIISGMFFCIEATILLFLKAYNYYPLLIPQSSVDDNLAGNLFSQFSITTTALLIAVLNLKNYWFFIFSVIYCVIEELFLSLGIYSHNWYQTWISFVGFICLFWLTKVIYQTRIIYRNNTWRYFFTLFGLYTLHMPTALWIQILAGIVFFDTSLLSDAWSNYAFVCLLNLTFLSLACMTIYHARLKFFWKVFLTLAVYGILLMARDAGVFNIKEGWFLTFSTIDIFGMYLSIFIMDQLIQK